MFRRSKGCEGQMTQNWIRTETRKASWHGLASERQSSKSTHAVAATPWSSLQCTGSQWVLCFRQFDFFNSPANREDRDQEGLLGNTGIMEISIKVHPVHMLAALHAAILSSFLQAVRAVQEGTDHQQSQEDKHSWMSQLDLELDWEGCFGIFWSSLQCTDWQIYRCFQPFAFSNSPTTPRHNSTTPQLLFKTQTKTRKAALASGIQASKSKSAHGLAFL